jgi:hypothetical protein
MAGVIELEPVGDQPNEELIGEPVSDDVPLPPIDPQGEMAVAVPIEIAEPAPA